MNTNNNNKYNRPTLHKPLLDFKRLLAEYHRFVSGTCCKVVQKLHHVTVPYHGPRKIGIWGRIRIYEFAPPPPELPIVRGPCIQGLLGHAILRACLKVTKLFYPTSSKRRKKRPTTAGIETYIYELALSTLYKLFSQDVSSFWD